MLRRRTRRTGQFDYRLTSDIDADKIDATYRNGVLTVNLPKSERAKGRRVTIRKE
jgi:HSP20 family protein